MDVSALTAFLAPCLAYLLRGAGEVADEAAQKLGADVWEQAKKLWAKLRPKVEEKPAAQEAARDLAARPDDDRARGALELQLEKLLASDPTLEREIAPIWQHISTHVVAGERGIAVGGNASGTFITGDQGSVRE
jgi:hypothetical protein